jgi:hypothetical protein
MLVVFGALVADFFGDFEDGVADESLQVVGERGVMGIGWMMSEACLRMEEIESFGQFVTGILGQVRVRRPWSSCATQPQRCSLHSFQCAKTHSPRNSSQMES